VQASSQREEVAVVLLPAALEVGIDGEGELPLDEVHQRGGLDLLTRGVVDYTSVAVDHAVAATVEALPRLTDALGGVEHCDDAGCRVLDANAVAARTGDGDPVERAEAVGAVVQGLAAQVGPATPLHSPLRSRSVISTLSSEVVTDASLRGTRLLDTARALSQPRPLAVGIVGGVVNPETNRLVVRPEQAETLFQHLRQGTPLEGDDLAERVDVVPDDVGVAVLNGAGTAGLAGRIESQLQGAGFQTVGTDNAPRFDHERTIVAYGAGDADAEVAAVMIAELLGEVELDPRDRPPTFEGDPVQVLVTVGQDLDDEGDD
jgi:polyisoprenyl-teichoic acid--peptidoglycan teichoic acid transferase